MMDEEIIPEGVELREFEDYGALRKQVFDSALNGFQKKFPQEYGKYRMEVEDLHYADPEEYDLDVQKDHLMKNRFLARRLRGTLKLYDRSTGTLLDTMKQTLMRVPYVTDRGTVIHNGNEYVTLNQARLSSGIYTRKKESGEIESHFNAKRGMGSSFKLYLEPETSIYKLNIGQANLRLYSLLHDLGVSDDTLEHRWGSDILAANKAKYDSRVLDRAYSKLVRGGSKGASKEDKAEAVREALGMTRISRSSVERTLPNLFERKVASEWRKEAGTLPQYANMPQMTGAAQTSDEWVKFDQKRQELEAKAEEQAQKEEAKRVLDERKKILEIEGLNKDIIDAQGKVDAHAVIKQLMENIYDRKKTEKDIRTKRVVEHLKEQNQAVVDQMKAEHGMETQTKKIHDHVTERQQEYQTNQMLGQLRGQLGIPQEPQPVHPLLAKGAKVNPGSKLDLMLRAKSDSDNQDYKSKHDTMRQLMWRYPDEFYIDSKGDHVWGVTHKKTSFKMHLPKSVVSDLGLADHSDKVDPLASTRALMGKAAMKGTYSPVPRNPKQVDTAVMPDGHVVDLLSLNDRVSGRDAELMDIADIQVKNLDRSKATGFGPRRYVDADIKAPILVSEDNTLVDGRHRLFKLQDGGGNVIPVKRVTKDDLAGSYADDGNPEYSITQVVNA
jgi:hypothetical protein